MTLPFGIHDDVPAADYHADPAPVPSLSSSIAKVLIEQTPRHAFTRHPRLNPNFAPKDDARFDLGSVAHELILDRGAGFDVVEADSWATKDARKAREKIRATGRTPILMHQWNSAVEMAKSVGARLVEIPECRALLIKGFFGLANGRAERVAIWQDIGGPVCRAMIDFMGPDETQVWDLKTTSVGLSDDSLARLIVNLGYDLSAGFYLRGLSQLRPDLAGRFRFRWIFVEDAAPFEVRVIEPTSEMLEIGDRKAALSIEKWRRCIETNQWPGYPPVISPIAAPDWSTARWLDRERDDDDALSFRPMSRAGVQGPSEMMEPV